MDENQSRWAGCVGDGFEFSTPLTQPIPNAPEAVLNTPLEIKIFQWSPEVDQAIAESGVTAVVVKAEAEIGSHVASLAKFAPQIRDDARRRGGSPAAAWRMISRRIQRS